MINKEKEEEPYIGIEEAMIEYYSDPIVQKRAIEGAEESNFLADEAEKVILKFKSNRKNVITK